MRCAPSGSLLAIPPAALLAALLAAWGCTPSAGAGGSGGHAAGSGGATTTVGAGGAAEVAACANCLDTECSAEKAACTADCFAIQACLDAVCSNLSATAAPDEGACQVYCQSLHPTGKAAHVAWVACASSGTCQPPCAGYSSDYDRCVAAENAGACQGALAACTASADCRAYQACAEACTTFPECAGCGAGPSLAAGEALYEAYQLCVDEACLAEGWLPSL